jgi:D-alanyl-D-alanine carboxypeptidase (penicillin-binding protein 5/6)
MRPGRAATAIAVGAALATLAIPTLASAGSTPATRASGHGATPATRPSSHGASPATPASAATGSPAVPAAGSLAARVTGGPLMASQGVVVSQSGQRAMPLPDVPASAWVIANASTGQVLAAKDPHAEFGPASTLKVLTAITLIPLLNPNAMVIVSKLAASQQPASAYLIAGHAYKVSDLFDALLLISANDAAVALTEATGSLAKGMALINAEARHLQAYDVDAKLPNGLPAAGQVTSAYDEALIARQALAMPAFMHYDAMLTSRLELKPGDWESMVNQNYLLTKYAGGIGGKIGWTVSSEATYVGLARRNGVTLIVTVLHCTSLEEITSAERLLNWGFAMNGKVSPVGVLVPPLPANAARHARATGRPRVVALSATRPGSRGNTTGYTLAGTGVVVASLGLGSLVRTRRRRSLRLSRWPTRPLSWPRRHPLPRPLCLPLRSPAGCAACHETPELV